MRIPVRPEEALRDIQASPVRMFENATNLETAISNRTPSIFAGYHTYPRNTK
jgi:hypothetical protein